MRRHRWYVILAVVGGLLLATLGIASAAEDLQGDQCAIAAGEIIESDLYVACNTLMVEGVIQGDLIGGAWSTVIAPRGRVSGDIWLAGGQLQIEGTVGDDVRFAGVDLDLTDNARLGPGSAVSAVALNVEVWDGATVPGDLLVFGYQAVVRGAVEGDVSFNGSALIIDGSVAGDVYARVGSGESAPAFIPFPFPFTVSFQTPGLAVRPEGVIGGNLTYSGAQPGNIEGQIGGTITFTLDQPRPDITQPALEEPVQPADLAARYLETVLTDVLTLMAAGILVMVAAPAWIREPARIIPRQLAPSFGLGLILALLAVPVGLLVLLISVLVVIVLATVTLGGFTGMALLLMLIVNAVTIGGFSFVILFMARLVFIYLFGNRLAHRLTGVDDRLAYHLFSLLLGTLLYAAVANVPLPAIGLIVNAAAIFVGLGALALHARQLYQRAFRPYTPPVHPAPIPHATLEALEALRGETPAPPPDSDDHPGPGMANLPAGFNWWRSERGGEEQE